MVLIETAQSGNWNDAATWVGGVVPANINDVKINTGHDVIFNVMQNGFATGINLLTINGNLIHSHTTRNYLKVAGNITGTGKWWIGTPQNPIMRPASGDTVFCNIMFGASNTYSVQHEIHGEVPNRVHTFLAEDSALGNNQVKLVDDLDLKINDKIGIGSGDINNNLTETFKGIYTVQSYDSVTKIVTLTTNLQTKRYANDLVISLTRSIQIDRVSGTTNYNATGGINNIVAKGVCIATGGYWLYWALTLESLSDNINCEGISVLSRNFVYYAKNVIIKKSVCACNNYAIVAGITGNLDIENCYGINSGICYAVPGRSIIKNAISQNATVTRGYYVKDSYFKNCPIYNPDNNGTIWDNCIFEGEISYLTVFNYGKAVFKNCTFKSNIGGWLQNLPAKLYNCLFEGEKVVSDLNKVLFNQNDIIESVNHNQIPGNYQAWCKGGWIETENNKLKFICESSDYPVFKDYAILVPANRDVKFYIGLIKDTANIICKLQFIEPSSDPLVDFTAQALAESTAQNSIFNQDLGIHYKSTTPRQLILRVFCQGLGNVTVDTSNIDNALADPVNY